MASETQDTTPSVRKEFRVKRNCDQVSLSERAINLLNKSECYHTVETSV